MMKQKINPELENLGNMALLVVDIQNDFCNQEGEFGKMGFDLKPIQEMIPRLGRFIDHLRKFNVPIFYSKQIEGGKLNPENLKRLIRIGKLKRVCKRDSWGSELYKLKPKNNEYVLEKYTYDFFSNPELNKILKDKEIKTVIVTGINLELCINTTFRSAFTKGFNIIIPKGLVETSLGADEKTRKYLFKICEQFFATIIESDELVSFLNNQRGK